MTGQSPPPDEARIFVQIPSYRDRECQWTVRDLFAKARHPGRIFVGICWQFDPERDQECFLAEARVPEPWSDHVRRVDFHASEAEGLGWARLKAQELWRGEEYTLQIDSHMRFVPDWDVRMLAELAACPSDWPALTIYPPCYWPPDQLQADPSPASAVQGVQRFSPDGFLTMTVHQLPPEAPPDIAKPTAGVAGGFIFTSARMITDVPSDPDIYFVGEEPALAVRLFTHGFDLFSPRETLLYHYYRRSDSRRPWDDASPVRPHERSIERMRRLCEPRDGDAAMLGRFGLGNARTLQDYQVFAGVDFRARTVASYALHFPFVYTDAVAEALVAASGLAIRPGAMLFVLEGEGVLFSEQRKAFCRLSPVATYLWCAIEDGVGLDDLVMGLVERSDLDPAAARRHVLWQICCWQGLGVIDAPASPAAGGADEPEPQPRWPVLPPLDPSPTERTWRLPDLRLRVRWYGARYAPLVAAALAHLPPDAAAPALTPLRAQVIHVFGIGRFHYVVRDDRFPPAMVEDERHVVAMLIRAVEQAACEDPGALLHLTGRLFGDDTVLVGNAELLVGIAAADDATPYAEGSLAARLSRAEPELAASQRLRIDRRTGLVQPVPAPLLVRAGLMEALTTWLGLPDELPRHDGFDGGAMVIPPDCALTRAEGRRIARIVRVELAADGATRLEPISVADGLAAVVGVSARGPLLDTVADGAAMIDWIESRSCLRLAMASSGVGVAALRGA